MAERPGVAKGEAHGGFTLPAQKFAEPGETLLFFGQDATWIEDLPLKGEIVERIVAEAEERLTAKLPDLIGWRAHRLG